MNKKLSKKARVALSVLAVVLVVLAVYFSISLAKKVGAAPTTPLFAVIDASYNQLVRIGSNGDMQIHLKNVCEMDTVLPQGAGPLTPNGNDLVIQKQGGEVVAMITNDGYVYLKGKIITGQASITEGTGNFLIKNGTSVVGKFDSNGNLIIKGSLTQAVATCGDGCCAKGLETGSSCATDCGSECWYEGLYDCGGSLGICKVNCISSGYYEIPGGSYGCPAMCCSDVDCR